MTGISVYLLNFCGKQKGIQWHDNLILYTFSWTECKKTWHSTITIGFLLPLYQKDNKAVCKKEDIATIQVVCNNTIPETTRFYVSEILGIKDYG